MIKKEYKILNKFGLHARPASQLVKIASHYKAELWITKNGQRINGKSIMGVMMLAAEQGSTIILEVDGDGEAEMLQEIEELIHNKFGEE